jgi:hypothetical protein
MQLTKTLLREELTIFNEKLKLTKETLILIENQDYVKYVLGISVPLNESQSFETKKLILQEALNIQDLAKSIAQKVGDKVNTVVTGINDLNDLSRIIYAIITDKSGALADKALTILKSELNDALNRFKTKMDGIISQTSKAINNVKNLLEPITTHLMQLGKKILGNYSGITGILAMLGLTTAIIWAEDEFLSLAIDKIMVWIKNDSGKNLSKLFSAFGNFFKEIFTRIGLNDIISFFTNFDNVLGPVVQSAKIISIMAMLLKPVVQRFNLKKFSTPQPA